MTFTKRKERQTIGRPAHIVHEGISAEVGFGVTASTSIGVDDTAPPDSDVAESVLADVEIKVNANQGPNEPAERRSWASSIRKHYEDLGYKARLYFRHTMGGPMFVGEVHPAIAGASDLLICPKEVISFSESPKQWRPGIDAETVEKMKAILNKDDLWEHAE